MYSYTNKISTLQTPGKTKKKYHGKLDDDLPITCKFSLFVMLETGIYLSDTRGMSANNIDGANTSTHSVDCPVQTQYPTESTESG